MLDEPEHDPKKWKPVLPAEAADWYEKSYAETRWPPIYSHQAYSTRLLEDAPEVARLIENITFDTELINEWSFAIAVENQDPYEYAREWVADNQKRVDSWLKF